jgi:hypothetical protein
MPQPIPINGITVSYPVIGDVEWGGEATKFAELVGIVLDKLGQGSQSTTNNITIATGNFTVTTGNTDLGGTLDVTGNFTACGLIIADDSTSTSAPPITFTGDTNTGIGRSGADTLDFITGGDTRFRIESTGQIKAVYESQVGTDYNTQLDNGYLCRAWVNFNGTGTVAIRGSGNVTSITDNGTGLYQVNFNNPMPDVNYSAIAVTVGGECLVNNAAAPTVNNYRISTLNATGTFFQDEEYVNSAVFR